MQAHISSEDERPWFRQFWPWFLILLPASVVIAGVSMVFIAAEGADDLVADEYYKRGLEINRELAREENAERLGISAGLQIAGDSITVLTRGPVSSAQLLLELSHPMEADRDFQVMLLESTPGEYRGRLQDGAAPRWHWTLSPQSDDESWQLSGVLGSAEFVRGGGG